MTTDQRSIPFGRPWIDHAERDAVADVLNGPILTHGPRCAAFEAAFADFIGGGCCCVAVSSCMAALHLSYLDLGIGPGDEVIVPAMTHVATAHAVELVGATPVFADCRTADGNVDADVIEGLITERTKAVSTVHFQGIPCDMPAIQLIADKYDLAIVEDCALAVGARHQSTGRHVGTFGGTGCFSFYPIKHIAIGEGGMLVTTDEALADRVRKKQGFGIDRDHTQRATPGQYDVTMLGLNYRMTEMQAAMGEVQVGKLEENLRRRAANFACLKEAVSTIKGVSVLDGPGNSHYALSLLLPDHLACERASIIANLKASGVGTSIYYPQPLPMMSYYADKYQAGRELWPNASRIADQSITLPVGPHLQQDDVDYIAVRVVEALSRIGGRG